MMKNKIKEAQPSNIHELKDTLKYLWAAINMEYFKNLAGSIPHIEKCHSYQILDQILDIKT